MSWFVLHTENGHSTSARNLARYLSNNDAETSYHYPVDNDGHVYNVVDTDLYANSVYEPGDSKSINLAFAGSWANWPRQTWFEKMQRGIDIAAYIAVRDARRCGLNPRVISPEEAKDQTGITDHNGVVIATGVGDHTDVGSGFPWDHFQQKLDEYAAEIAPARATRGLAGPAYPGLTIAQGATGRHVITVQERLNVVTNAGLLVDGVFGPLTARAIAAFQRSRGLVADGQVGLKTWAELFADRQPSAEQPCAPTISRTRGAVAPPAGDPDSFPLPAGCYWGPLDGPDESWSNLSGDEPQHSKDGLKRWQEATGVAGSGVYDGATKEAAVERRCRWRPPWDFRSLSVSLAGVLGVASESVHAGSSPTSDGSRVRLTLSGLVGHGATPIPPCRWRWAGGIVERVSGAGRSDHRRGRAGGRVRARRRAAGVPGLWWTVAKAWLLTATVGAHQWRRSPHAASGAGALRRTRVRPHARTAAGLVRTRPRCRCRHDWGGAAGRRQRHRAPADRRPAGYSAGHRARLAARRPRQQPMVV